MAPMPKETELNIADQFEKLEKEFVARLSIFDTRSFRLKNANVKVAYIYNPLIYALNLHNQYIRKYCNSHKKILFLGMNPGPFGMVQTGVPFGEIAAVRDYLKITGKVDQPPKVHPKRPIEGMLCKRSEVSGNRLWGLIKDISDNDPFKFFKNSFVYNYCPLALLSDNGCNITPAELKTDDQKTLTSVCDEYLNETLKLFEVDTVIAIGVFAEQRAVQVLKDYKLKNIKVIRVPHPSPRVKNSTNASWQETTKKILKENGLLEYMQC